MNELIMCTIMALWRYGDLNIERGCKIEYFIFLLLLFFGLYCLILKHAPLEEFMREKSTTIVAQQFNFPCFNKLIAAILKLHDNFFVFIIVSISVLSCQYQLLLSLFFFVVIFRSDYHWKMNIMPSK